jgi:hypothetical protein
MSAARAERLKQVANRATLRSSDFFTAHTQALDNDAANFFFAKINYKTLALTVT